MAADPLELERRAVGEATRVLRDRLNLVGQRALAVYNALPGEARAASAKAIGDVIRLIADEDVVSEPIRQAVNEASALGVKIAEEKLALHHNRRVLPSMTAIRATMAAHDGVRAEVEKAAKLAASARSSADVEAALAVARRSLYRVEASTRFAVNSALSDAVSAVNEAHGALDLWVAERDACLHCLAHQGHTVPAGGDFPNVSFAQHPLAGGRPRPPLHPNCRCRIVPHLPAWGSDYPDALKREAQRSVLRGWSLPSESQRARLAAAERLLTRGSTLPKSVQDYARRSLSRGHFDRGRSFPVLPTHPDDRIELKRPGKKRAEKVEVPKAEPTKGSAFDTLPQKAAPVTEGFSRYVRSVHGWSSGDDELDGDVLAINPNFSQGRQWQVNCQRVAVAYELRRRGYDVVALPNDKRPGTKQYTRTDLGLLWEKFHMGPSGEVRGVNSPNTVLAHRGWQYVMSAKYSELARLADELPAGGRAWIVSVWNGGGGHIWNVEKLADGKVVWLDAQPGKVLSDAEIKQYARNARTLHFMRTDDLTLTDEAVTMVTGRPTPS